MEFSLISLNESEEIVAEKIASVKGSETLAEAQMEPATPGCKGNALGQVNEFYFEEDENLGQREAVLGRSETWLKLDQKDEDLVQSEVLAHNQDPNGHGVGQEDKNVGRTGS